MNLLEKFDKKLMKNSLQNDKKFIPFSVGDTISVAYKISEGNNVRIQNFEGVVIAKSKNPKNYNSSFVVRKISYEIGVERKFLTHSPLVEEIKLIKKGIVKKAKLYYLRDRVGKATKIKEDLSVKKSKKN